MRRGNYIERRSAKSIMISANSFATIKLKVFNFFFLACSDPFCFIFPPTILWFVKRMAFTLTKYLKRNEKFIVFFFNFVLTLFLLRIRFYSLFLYFCCSVIGKPWKSWFRAREEFFCMWTEIRTAFVLTFQNV